MSVLSRSLAILSLSMLVFCLDDTWAQSSEFEKMEREVRAQVKGRIQSYMEHLESEIQREEKRRAAQAGNLKEQAEAKAATEKIRKRYLENRPSEEKAQARRLELELQYEENQRKQSEERKRVEERYSQREMLLRAAQEKYDFLDPAEEYGLTRD